MPKAVDAFRNISEVSDELGVKKHVLRFWEARFTQLKPMKRGGGRRYYRPADIQLLLGIRHLLQSEGYSIRGVQKILRQGGTEDVKRIGRAQAAERATRTRQQPAAQPRDTRRVLTEAELGVLHKVAAELGSLQAMLGDAEVAASPAPHPKRSAAGG